MINNFLEHDSIVVREPYDARPDEPRKLLVGVEFNL